MPLDADLCIEELPEEVVEELDEKLKDAENGAAPMPSMGDEVQAEVPEQGESEEAEFIGMSGDDLSGAAGDTAQEDTGEHRYAFVSILLLGVLHVC